MLFDAERREGIYPIYERSRQFGRYRSLLLASHRSDPTISARGEVGVVRRPAAVEAIRRDRRNGRNLPNFTIGRALFKSVSLNLPDDTSGRGSWTTHAPLSVMPKAVSEARWRFIAIFVAAIGLDLFVTTMFGARNRLAARGLVIRSRGAATTASRSNDAAVEETR